MARDVPGDEAVYSRPGASQASPSPPAGHVSPKHWLQSQRWAAALLALSGWVILDTETTGLDGAAECCQIAVLAPDGEVLLDTYLRPKQAIPEDVVAIHGITDERVAEAPAFPEVWPRLREVLDGKLIVAYNVRFDRRMLDQTAEAHGVDVPELLALRWADAMEAYAAYYGEWGGRSYRWQRLPALDAQAHDAVADCRSVLALLKLMAAGEAPPPGVPHGSR